MSEMTFNEAYQRANGYATRIWDTEGKVTLHSMLVDIKKAHEEEVRQALCKFPLHDELVEYDVVGNERHKVACALRRWVDDEVVRESADDHLCMLYMKLYDELPGDEPHEKLAIAIRDRLIGLLEA